MRTDFADEISCKAFIWKNEKGIGDIKTGINCEDRRGMEFAQVRVQWVVSSSAVLNLRVYYQGIIYLYSNVSTGRRDFAVRINVDLNLENTFKLLLKGKRRN
jgi:hypothetical protein